VGSNGACLPLCMLVILLWGSAQGAACSHCLCISAALLACLPAWCSCFRGGQRARTRPAASLITTMQPPVSAALLQRLLLWMVACWSVVPQLPRMPERSCWLVIPPAAAGQTQWQRPTAAAAAAAAALAAPAAAAAAAPWQRPAAAPAAAPAAEDGRLYLPAMQFGGARPGYVFKTGPSGLGYYLDRPDTERRLGALLLSAGLAWQLPKFDCTWVLVLAARVVIFSCSCCQPCPLMLPLLRCRRERRCRPGGPAAVPCWRRLWLRRAAAPGRRRQQRRARWGWWWCCQEGALPA
jgi:hypothetical protein